MHVPGDTIVANIITGLILLIWLVVAGLVSVTLLKRRRWVLLAILQGIVVASVAYMFIGAIGPLNGVDRLQVIDRKSAADGTEFVLTQAWNGQVFEPYAVAFWVKRPGKPWEWCYIDHQDAHWRRGAIQIDADKQRIAVVQDRTTRLRFDMKSDRNGLGDQALTRAPQAMPAGWEPVENGEYRMARSAASTTKD